MRGIYKNTTEEDCAINSAGSTCISLRFFRMIFACVTNLASSPFFFLVKHQIAVDFSEAARRPHPLENITSNHWEKWAIKVPIPLNIFSAGVSSSITHSGSQGYISRCNVLQHHFEPWCIIKKTNEWSHGWPFWFFSSSSVSLIY